MVLHNSLIPMKTISKIKASVSELAKSVTPAFPKPQAEHDWLRQFAGDWLVEADCYMNTDGPPEESKGIERIRSLGGFWLLVEIEADMMGKPFHGVQTLGFDTEKKRFIGTWVDSLTSELWNYEGTLNREHTALTLNSEGVCPQTGQLTKVRSVLEITDNNHKLYTSYILNKDGEWTLALKARGLRIHD